jgi:site-specific DNA-methyltransferase (adenine-specific)
MHCVVTSPPYWGLRDYGVAGQIGLESSYVDYVNAMVGVFRKVRRVLRKDGTLWLNLGDSYTSGGRSSYGTYSPDSKQATHSAIKAVQRSPMPDGLKPKDLVGIPWRVAFALQADGWWLRQDIIWSKPNPMPESVTDRCTKAHEYLFLMSKSERYYYDAGAIKEAVTGNAHSRGNGVNPKAAQPGNGIKQNTSFSAAVKDLVSERNKRSVWEIATAPFPESHFATFPPDLIEPCILAGCPEGGTVLDPFGGAGTTGLVADRLKRDSILIELNPDYAAMAERRIRNDAGMFAELEHTGQS